MNAPSPLDAGRALPLPESRFLVPGMRCASCIGKLERELPKAPGIAGARVHFGAKQLVLTHVPELDVPAMLGAISALGFDAQPVEPLVAPADGGETRQLVKALAVAAFAAMNIMMLSVGIWAGASAGTRGMFHWISAVIALPAIAYAGQPFFRSAWSALRRGRTNMDVPISIGLILTCAMSLFETVVGGEHAWFDGATMLCAFLLAGRVLDAMMRERARDGVAALVRQAATGAMALEADGSTRWVAAADIRPGMALLVAAGERIAADALVEKGESSLDRSLLTGESARVPVSAGDRVDAGTLNCEAPLTLRVIATPEDSALAEIARLMEAAGQSRSLYVRVADRAARYYAPAVHLLAALSFAGWMLAGAGWHHSLLIAVAVLLITCPCALGLAVPVAQVVASGALMRAGILVKDGSALERLATVDRALLDKTGTLTLGRPMADIAPLDAEQRGVALALAQASRHPVSLGIAEALRRAGVVPALLEDVREEPGRGMLGLWNRIPVALERPSESVSTPAAALRIGDFVSQPILVNDALRPDAAAALAALREAGIESSILSGDAMGGVAPVARALGLTAQAGALPADKLALIERLEQSGAKVLMVGDGLNDGPALSAATAALAPASASDVGRQAADMVFLGESLLALPRAVRAARATMRVVRQNFAMAIGYNVIAVPFAIAGYVTPLIAALAMSGSSLLVIVNALRLRSAAR